MKKKTVFEWQPELPIRLQCFLPKPCNDPNDADCVLFSTDWDEEKSGIFKYNLITNQLQFLSKYRQKFKPTIHAQFIDASRDRLFLFGGRSRKLNIYNYKLKEWKRYIGGDLITFPSISHISSSNQAHIIQDNYHKILDCNSLQTNNKMKINYPRVRCPKLIYYESKDTLFIMGGYHCSVICSFGVKDESGWIKYEQEMPHNVNNDMYDAILAFDNIIFVFYFQTSGSTDIYCFDLINNKWFKSKYCIPGGMYSSSRIFVIKHGTNMAHILDFGVKKHVKVCLIDLIPNELKKLHQNRFNKLVIGYVKRQEKVCDIYNVPFVLKQLIFKYFPQFL